MYWDLSGTPRLCGEESGFTKNRYLYFTDFGPTDILDLFHKGVCVDECPTSSTTNVPCTPGKWVTCSESEPLTVRPTIKLMNWCIPDFTHDADNLFTPENKARWEALWEEFKNGPAGSSAYDLYLSSRAIYVSIAMAPIYCFIFIAVMSAFAETIAWLCVALTQIGLIGAAVACWLYRGKLEEGY